MSAERTIRVGFALAIAKGCILCHGPADRGGMFIPDDPAAWGARPGKGRVAFYALCRRCADPPDLEAIEARLARGIRRAA